MFVHLQSSQAQKLSSCQQIKIPCKKKEDFHLLFFLNTLDVWHFLIRSLAWHYAVKLSIINTNSTTARERVPIVRSTPLCNTNIRAKSSTNVDTIIAFIFLYKYIQLIMKGGQQLSSCHSEQNSLKLIKNKLIQTKLYGRPWKVACVEKNPQCCTDYCARFRPRLYRHTLLCF